MAEEFMEFPSLTADTEMIKSFFEKETGKIEELTGDELLARSFGVIMCFNRLSDEQKAGVYDKILKYLRKLKEKLDKIAREWGVSNYTISVGFGIKVSLTFKIK